MKKSRYEKIMQFCAKIYNTCVVSLTDYQLQNAYQSIAQLFVVFTI